jgi:hypothetical protein
MAVLVTCPFVDIGEVPCVQCREHIKTGNLVIFRGLGFSKMPACKTLCIDALCETPNSFREHTVPCM